MKAPSTSGSARVGPKGQIVIPKAMRDRVGLEPGATVFLDQAEDGTITLEFGWNDVMDAPAYFARFPVRAGEKGRTSIDTLHALDAEDEALRERKLGPWTSPSPSSTPSPSSPSSAGKRAGSGSGGRSRKRSAARERSD